MGKINQLIDKLSKENLFKYYLPIFRIYISYHIIKKVFLAFNSTSLIFGNVVDFQKENLSKFSFLLNKIGEFPLIYIFLIFLSVFYAFGIGKRITVLLLAILLYIFNTEIIALYGNGGDNYLTFIIIYLIFTDSFQYLSFSKSKYKGRMKELSNFVSNLAVYSILIHICLIYFVSFVHKIHSDVWYNGVANYYILNLERYKSPFNHYFSKNAFFIGLSTYFTLAFELLFPLFIWNRKYRNILIVSGIFLHLGIYFFMMIYDFEILFIMVYGFLFTNGEWKKLYNRLNNKLYKVKWLKLAK